MSRFLKTMVLRFSKKNNPPLYFYPISIENSGWSPSDEFRDVDDWSNKTLPPIEIKFNDKEWIIKMNNIIKETDIVNDDNKN